MSNTNTIGARLRLFARGLGAAFLLCGGLAFVGARASAAEISVTTLADTDDGACDANCSLREAIVLANDDARSPGADSITFAVAGTIRLGTELPRLEGQLSIADTRNNSSGSVSISGDANGNDVPDAGDVRVLWVAAGAEVSLARIGIRGGYADGGSGTFGSGGGIVNAGRLGLAECTVGGSEAAFSGGGIYNEGVLSIDSSTILNNRGNDGGGIATRGPDARLALFNSTLFGNTARILGAGVYSSTGTSGIPDEPARTLIRNCTIVGNRAEDNGGGVHNAGGATRILNSTITRNEAYLVGAGGVSSSAARGTWTRVNSSIVAGNRTVRGAEFGDGPDLGLVRGSANTFDSEGYNLVGPGDGAAQAFNKTGDRRGVLGSQVLMGDLDSNGGPTLTCKVLPGSPAINAGSPNAAELPAFDQRGAGFARVRAGRADVGAFEADITAVESLVVTTARDEDDGTSDPAFGSGTSLREALAFANAGASTSTAPPTVTFSATAFPLPAPRGGHAIALDARLGELKISRALRVSGPGASTLTVDGGSATRLFNISAGAEVTISGLRLANGRILGDDGDILGDGRVFAQGGAILNAGKLLLLNATLENNRAQGVIGGTRTRNAQGGAIYNTGVLTLDGCVFDSNAAVGGFLSSTSSSSGGSQGSVEGGAILSGVGTTLMANRCTFSNNSSTETTLTGLGGAISSRGTLSVSGCYFSGNRTRLGAGAVYLYSGRNFISNSTFVDNEARFYGGALYNDASIALTEIDNCTFSRNTAGSGGAIVSVAPLRLRCAAFFDNRAILGANEAPEVESQGGAILAQGSEEIRECFFQNNSAGTSGGAIHSTTIALVERCTLVGNSIGNPLRWGAYGQGGGGGAITSRGTLTLTFSTLRGNRAGNGGGLYVADPGTARVFNSTISDNTAATAGGGIRVHRGPSLSVLNSTIAFNSAAQGGGIAASDAVALSSATVFNNTAAQGANLWGDGGLALRIGNTIVALQGASANHGSNLVVPGAFSSQGYNLFSSAPANLLLAATDQAGTAANPLGAGLSDALGYNGGPTTTLALQPGSPAIDAANPVLAPVLAPGASTWDQRGQGFHRVRRGREDIGAFEVQNDGPSNRAFAKQAREDEVLALARADFEAAFSDTDDGESLTRVKISALPTQGTLRLGTQPVTTNQVIDAAGLDALTYTPRAEFAGSDFFEYQAADAFGFAPQAARVSIFVGAQNDAPALQDDAFSTPEDTRALFDVLANDADGDGDALTLTSVEPQSADAAIHIENNKVRFAPAGDKTGRVAFRYTASDGQASSSAWATVQVLAVNDPPATLSQMLGTDEDTPLDITLVASDVDSVPSSFRWSIITGPAHGELTGEGASRRYTPAANFEGIDEFWFRVSDGLADSFETRVTITVGGHNDAPTAAPDTATTDEDTPITLQVLANDRDADGQALRISRVATTADTHGTVSIVGDTLLFQPDANFNGASTWSYTASDGALESTATVTVQVLAVNDAPVALSRTIQASPHAQTPVLLIASDVDGDTLSYEFLSPLRPGILHGAPPNLMFTPAPGFSGTQSFTFRVSDGQLQSETATMSLQVPGAHSQVGPDKTPPSISIASAPVATPRLSAIGGLAADPAASAVARAAGVATSGLARVTVQLRRFDNRFWNGRAWQATAFDLGASLVAGGRWRLAAPLPTPAQAPQGRYLWAAVARDKAGNTARAQQHVLLDSIAPTVLIDTPRAGTDGIARISKLEDVRGRTSEAARVEVALRNARGEYFNGRGFAKTPVFIAATARASTWSLHWPLFAAGSGRYVILVRAVDAAGNPAYASRTVVVQSSPAS